MRIITTNYIGNIGNVTIDTCIIYQTTCDDEHFNSIILENRNLLIGEFVSTNQLYVLMDNESIEDTTNYYASISFNTRKRANNTIYQVCIITKEEGISIELLRNFLSKVIDGLSLDDSIRIALSSNPLETTYSIASIELIELCLEDMFEELGIEDNERQNQNQ